MKVEDCFVNERGNAIRMVVTGGGSLSTSVKIFMAGPTSTVTNEITLMEARRLRDLLNEVVGQQ
ncbi:hypothetical protein PMI42_04862 [Bradyrhizobium sp. YR681]|uniref:hypothetical protein n=1 Tax=Bradyrhizobium sp. YR681 TaxID=1144344 RepID=UPI0002710D43|nr:hypothetical protein [Bradyrhizobium sp. YR681]EJN11847.1 hypothetical protein PMI42_04862 [Bradyrhizobium sp. YR681]